MHVGILDPLLLSANFFLLVNCFCFTSFPTFLGTNFFLFHQNDTN